MEADSLDVFLNRISQALRSHLPGAYWVRAEILKVDFKTHWYVELAAYDGAQKAKANARIWASNHNIVTEFEHRTALKLQPGLKILFECTVQFHHTYGFCLIVQRLDPVFSLGDMVAKLQRIRERLTQLGELKRNLTLPQPKDFTRVAVIAPQQAAGLEDFKTRSSRLAHWGLCHFDFYPAIFQGTNAVDSLIAAMTQLYQRHHAGHRYDAIAIVRGGGDKAGLYALNDIKIARGVCRSPVPVLVGIGHENDNTILDEVANQRFATPSLVASHIQHCIVQQARRAHEHFQQIVHVTRTLAISAKQEIQKRHAALTLRSHQRMGHSQRILAGLEQRVHQHAQLTLQKAKHLSHQQQKHVLQAAHTVMIGSKQEVQKRYTTLTFLSHKKVDLAQRTIGTFQQGLQQTAHLSLLKAKHHNREQHKQILLTGKQGVEHSRRVVEQCHSGLLTDAKTQLKDGDYHTQRLKNTLTQHAKHGLLNSTSLLQQTATRLHHQALTFLHAERNGLEAWWVKIHTSYPVILTHNEHQLHVLHEALIRYATRQNTQAKHEINVLIERVLNLDPKNVLQKGFALIKKPDGQVLTSVHALIPHESIVVELKDGSANATIEGLCHE